MSGKLRMGVLGLGRMGLMHCEMISKIDGLELVAGSTRSEELRNAAIARFGIPVYTEHEELINDKSIDWIVVATTSDQHARWTLLALEADKDVIVEKPLTLSADEAVAVFELAARKNGRVVPHQSRRWDRDFTFVRRVLDDRILGAVYRMHSCRASYSAGWAGWGAQGMGNPWRLKRRYGGGMLNDWGPHLLDQLFLLTESPVQSVFGWMGGRVWTDEVDDHFWAEIQFRDGVSARIEASNNFRIPLPRWTIVGTKGELQVEGSDMDRWTRAKIVGERWGIPEEIHYDVGGQELAGGFYPDFLSTIGSGKDPSITPQQTIQVMRVMDMIRESAMANTTIRFE